jgi:uncharacterized membrane protein YfcA
MQFGRIHGIALIVLGLLLIVLQIDFSFAGRSEVNTPSQPASASTEIQRPQPTRLGPLAGIIGAASLIGGFVIFATARRRDEPPAQRAVK